MAILEGITASVVVNGESLVEYDEDVDEVSEFRRDSNIVVKYIEAVSGAQFEVTSEWDLSHWKGCDGLWFQVDLDGKSKETSVCEFKHRDRSTYLDAVRSCVDRRWTQEKFRFAEIVSGTDY